jgi:hypothetical protein
MFEWRIRGVKLDLVSMISVIFRFEPRITKAGLYVDLSTLIDRKSLHPKSPLSLSFDENPESATLPQNRG